MRRQQGAFGQRGNKRVRAYGRIRPVLKRAGDDLLSGSSVISGKCRAEGYTYRRGKLRRKAGKRGQKYKSANSELMSSMKKVTRITSFFIVPLGIIAFLGSAACAQYDNSRRGDILLCGSFGYAAQGACAAYERGFAIGVIRLSKKNALVQELYSLENLAHCDVLCLDKTGTLTVGHMEVEQVIPLGCDKARAQQL